MSEHSQEDRPRYDHEHTRRSLLKRAVAAGGVGALAACLDRAEEPVPRGPTKDKLSSLPTRQHAWNDRIRTDDSGNHVLPKHQLLLYLTLPRSGPPNTTARKIIESTFQTLDQAYERSHAGLIYSIGYSPRYFSRFDSSLPGSITLPEPRALSSFETPTFDRQDALLHLVSDRADVILAAEEALRGNRPRINTIDFESALTDVFRISDRRSGFIGPGLPAKKQDSLKGIPDSNPVPENSPLFMGFKVGFRQNQATESHVTIRTGPFAGGTTKHVSNLRMRLDDWYTELDNSDRIAKIFSPTHAAEDRVDGVGVNLGASNGVSEDIIENIETAAREDAIIGHAQKAARANRKEDGTVKTLRRHFESTDDGEASLHFPSLQREISTFENVREAMNGTDLTEIPTIRQRVHNGILEYIFVKRRGNFLIPPRSLRALPTPRGSTPGLN